MEPFEDEKEKYQYLQDFFVLKRIEEKGNHLKLTFQCQKCSPKIQTFQVPSNALKSNLKRHVERAHKNCLAQFDCLKPGLKRRHSSFGSVEEPPAKVVPKIFGNQANTVTQAQVNRLVRNYVVKSYLPFTHVRNEPFRELIGGLQPNRTVQCYQTLVKEISICLTMKTIYLLPPPFPCSSWLGQVTKVYAQDAHSCSRMQRKLSATRMST